ncbi:hypothetical protein LINPERHAP1_LOCUS2349 [Linum perenne]
MKEATKETPTTAADTGTENPAPVTCDGNGAGAISWPDTKAAIKATNTTIESAAALENAIAEGRGHYIFMVPMISGKFKV